MNDIEDYAVVDEFDNFLYAVRGKKALHNSGDITRSGCINRGPCIHRSSHLFIEVFGGKFIIQKKALHTENGDKWSSAVSGHVRLGETYLEAIVREAKEEVDLTIDPEELVKVAKISPSEETGNEFAALYTYLLDPSKEHVRPACDEVDELITCQLKDVITDVHNNGRNYSPAFVLLFNIFLTLYKEDMEEDSNGHRQSTKVARRTERKKGQMCLFNQNR
jgi:isopentenyldiphosphate isomerase